MNEAVSTERLSTKILDAFPAEMYSTVLLEAIRDPDLSLEQIQRRIRTIFINHSERMLNTKNNQESKRYQESNCRGRETGTMSTAFITCHYCKKLGHKIRDCKRRLESEVEMENQENSIMGDRKNGIDTIQVMVIQISSVSSKYWKSKK